MVDKRDIDATVGRIGVPSFFVWPGNHLRAICLKTYISCYSDNGTGTNYKYDYLICAFHAGSLEYWNFGPHPNISLEFCLYSTNVIVM